MIMIPVLVVLVVMQRVAPALEKARVAAVRVS